MSRILRILQRIKCFTFSTHLFAPEIPTILCTRCFFNEARSLACSIVFYWNARKESCLCRTGLPRTFLTQEVSLTLRSSVFLLPSGSWNKSMAADTRLEDSSYHQASQLTDLNIPHCILFTWCIQKCTINHDCCCRSRTIYTMCNILYTLVTYPWTQILIFIYLQYVIFCHSIVIYIFTQSGDTTTVFPSSIIVGAVVTKH